MTKFNIDKNIKRIDDFFYIEFFPSNYIYADKIKNCLKTYDLNNIDEEIQRQNLFIQLTEIYKEEFTNNFYL